MERELIFSATKKDFRVDWFSGDGGGGQHRNKHKNCCRITHKESELVGICQEHKSAKQNKKIAFHRLVKKLIACYIPKQEKSRVYGPQKWTRTYDKHENRVVDHLTGEKFSYKHTIGKGDIGILIEARLAAIPSPVREKNAKD